MTVNSDQPVVDSVASHALLTERTGQADPLEALVNLLIDLQEDDLANEISLPYRQFQLQQLPEATPPALSNLPPLLDHQDPLSKTTLGHSVPEAETLPSDESLAQRVQNLEQQLYLPTDIINPLLPLITELLLLKTDETKESLLRALSSLIDEAIHQRTQQNQAKMGAAIAEILPAAIAYEIEHSPQTLAKAIAPEMAIAIQEQIKLDPAAFSAALGPQMGNAIKNQIEVERDSMVDALYPVIGNTISKFMAEVVQSINHKIETTFSLEGFARKIRARLQGVSEAELILRESLPFSVQAVFLIHKESGLVIREYQANLEQPLDASMLAGVLTAIRSFVRECVSQGDQSSELHDICYDASKILIEVAGYCYLAIVIKGDPPQPFIRKMRDSLGKIILKFGPSIAVYDGDTSAVSDEINPILEALLVSTKTKKQFKFPIGLTVSLGLLFLLCGTFLYRGHIAHRAEQKTAALLDQTPELSIYRINPQVHRGKLILTGRVPTRSLVRRAGQVASTAAPNWPVANQVVAVNVPPIAEEVEQEVRQIIRLYNRKPGIAVTSLYDADQQQLQIQGIVSNIKDAESLAKSLQEIAGIKQVSSVIRLAPVLSTRLYFYTNSTQIQLLDTTNKLKEVQQFLALNPDVHLKIIGHGDIVGERTRSQNLGLSRSQVVKGLLVTRGVSDSRLVSSGSKELPPEIPKGSPAWFSRCVRFEPFIPEK
jgi:outer membrane protein OmpA-like peptidoglycan-associated protein